MRMSYNFKLWQEAMWMTFVAAAIVVLEGLARWDPATVGDWRTWAIGLLGGAARAAAAAALASITRPR